MQSYSYKVNADQIAMKNNGKNLYSALPNKRTGESETSYVGPTPRGFN